MQYIYCLFTNSARARRGTKISPGNSNFSLKLLPKITKSNFYIVVNMRIMSILYTLLLHLYITAGLFAQLWCTPFASTKLPIKCNLQKSPLDCERWILSKNCEIVSWFEIRREVQVLLELKKISFCFNEVLWLDNLNTDNHKQLSLIVHHIFFWQLGDKVVDITEQCRW